MYKSTDRGYDLRLGDEAVGQVDAAVAVGGHDLYPGHLVTGQWLVGRGCGQIPAKDGCHIAAPHLEGRCQVGCLRCDFWIGHC